MKSEYNHMMSAAPLSLPQFLSFGVAICSALDKLHKKDRIHTDIRPQNIHWDSENSSVELAYAAEGEGVSLFSEARLSYLSPEQTGRMNRTVDYRTDLYSLGAVFYELLAGDPPFITEDPLEMIHSHIAKEPPPVHQHRVDVPEQVSAIVMRLLRKSAEDRYQSAFGLRHDLERCAEQLDGDGRVRPFELGESDFTGIFRIPQKLYGREEEVDLLLESFERVSNGPAELLMVAGYSGVGKTALVHEVHKPITAKRGYFIEGKFDQFQRNIPYFAWGQAFREFVSQLLLGSDSQLDDWKTQVLEAVGLNGKLLTDVIPNLESAIGPQPDVPELDGQATQNRFNFVFQSFIKVIAREKHPLVVFLDDLQWIDPASLNLLKSLLTDPDLANVLIIGAYRDNEVDAVHPLMMGVAELQEADINLKGITLKPLSENDVSALCSETLRCQESESRPLAQLIYSKTGGNAFFTHRMLHSLHEGNYLAFGDADDRWLWDLDSIRQLDVSDNVVDLMLAKVRKLPEATQEMLQLAACIGNQFEISTLTMLAHHPAEVVHEVLQVCLKEQILLPGKELYKFAHDRIQQAAYALINPDARAQLHRQIGFSMHDNTPVDEIDDKIFDIANHLNLAIDAIDQDDDRLLISQLNLQAGKKAKSSAAYSDAKKFIEIGLELLGPDSWQEHYALTLELHNENGQLASLTGQFEQIETAAALIQANAKSTLDKSRIDMIRIEAETLRYNLHEALQIGLEALKEHGIEIPMQPTQEDYQALKNRLVELLADRPEKNWAELPEMTDGTALAISALLASEMSTSYISYPPIYEIVSYQNAILTLESGISPWSPFAFAGVASVDISLADHETPHDVAREHIVFATEMQQIARDLMEKPVTFPSRTRTLMLLSFVSAWIEPIEKGIELTKDTYRSGYQTGDMFYAAYGTYLYAIESFGAGMALPKLQSQLSDYVKLFTRMGQVIVPKWLPIFTQTAQNFMEITPDPDKLQGVYFDEDIWLPEALDLNDVCGGHAFRFCKLMLAYHFDLDNKLEEYIHEVEKVMVGARAIYSVAIFYLYAALSKLRLAGERGTKHHQETIKLVESHLQIMKVWSRTVPTTFQHKYDLIAAEMARVTGDLDRALSCYEQAISGARANGFIHEEALANELYSRFWIERDYARFAGPLLDEAHRLYRKWGATAKAEHLAKRYPEWMSKEQAPTADEAATPMEHMAEKLDLHTILKASQEIAGEMELNSLITKIMKIVVENAGAQRGFLIMEEGGQWMIVSGNEFDSIQPLISEPQGVDTSEMVSQGIINYAVRTKESVVLVDAANEGDFMDDQTFQHRQSKSILCIPLINQDKVSGILYLENDLAKGVFTLERVELLNLLSSQMALALDKARLYDDLALSEEKFKGVFDSIIDVFARADLEGNCLLISPSVFDVIGYTPEEVVGRNFAQFYARPEDWRLLAERLIETGELRDIESEICKKDGNRIIISSNARIYYDEGSPAGIESVFRDITHLKEAKKELYLYHERLQAMTSELIFTEERERQRIATELHDGAAQSLALTRLQLAEATEAVSGSSSEIMLDKASRQVRRSLEQIRSVLLDLSSPTLHQMGLSAGLSDWLDHNVRVKHGLRTVFRDECGDVLLTDEIRLLLFRNVCELLTNVVKHGQAQRVSVSMARVGQTLQIVVEDDGVGFDPDSVGDKPDQSGGFGLFSIAVRMVDMGGSLDMLSAPGKGCKATLVAPLGSATEGSSQ